MTALHDVLRATALTDGFFLRSEAVSLGLDDASLRRGLRNGTLVRIRQGAYTFTDLWQAADERARHLVLLGAVTRQCRKPVAASHHSAALLHGMDLWEVPLQRAHLTRLDGGAGRVMEDVTHHEGRWTDGELTQSHGLSATVPARAALESALLVDVEHGLCIVDSGLREGLFTDADLSRRASRMRAWPGAQHLQVVTRLADGRSESVGESRSKHLMWRCGIPAPQLQFEIHDRGVLVGVTDFAWPECGVLGEFDGKVKYGRYLRDGETPGDAVFREKQREDLLRRLTGWQMIPITWSMLYDREETARAVWSMLRAAA